MFAIYAGVSLAIWIGFGYVRAFIQRFYLKGFDRQAGALLGALKGGLLCIVITMFAVTLLGETRRQEICQSRSGLIIARSINQLRGVMPKEIHPVLAPYLNKFDDVMKQTNPAYAQQPNFPDLPDGKGGDLLKDVREYLGELMTTSQSGSGQEVQGTIQGISWPNDPQPNASTVPSQLPQLDLRSVQDIFSQVTTPRQ
jgi:hypothetical protein